MRTTLNIDDEALALAMTCAKGHTKTEVINPALRQFARTKQRKKLLDLRGKVRWEGDIDALTARLETRATSSSTWTTQTCL